MKRNRNPRHWLGSSPPSLASGSLRVQQGAESGAISEGGPEHIWPPTRVEAPAHEMSEDARESGPPARGTSARVRPSSISGGRRCPSFQTSGNPERTTDGTRFRLHRHPQVRGNRSATKPTHRWGSLKRRVPALVGPGVGQRTMSAHGARRCIEIQYAAWSMDDGGAAQSKQHDQRPRLAQSLAPRRGGHDRLSPPAVGEQPVLVTSAESSAQRRPAHRLARADTRVIEGRAWALGVRHSGPTQRAGRCSPSDRRSPGPCPTDRRRDLRTCAWDSDRSRPTVNALS